MGSAQWRFARVSTTLTAPGPSAPAQPVPTSSPGPRGRAPRYLEAPGPWRRRDGIVTGALALLGVVGVVICWLAVSDEPVWREQLGWAIGAVFCTGLVVVAAAIWVLVGLRTVRRGMRDLRREQRRLFDLPATLDVAAPGAAATASLETGFVTAPRMRRVHRADCLLMLGKAAVTVAASDVDRYERCGVCRE
ncbi:MAG: hypothetical protein ACT4P1_16060 [Sporichthyaceae bacterium]